jgi:tetratricopeptide (TPR) repeat protein
MRKTFTIWTIAYVLITTVGVGLSAAGTDLDALMENGHWKRAKDLAEASYRTHPQDGRAAYMLSRVRSQFGELDDALKYAQMAVQSDPKNASYHLQLAQAYGDLAEKASMLRQFGLARKCRTEIEAAMAIDPRNPDNLDAQMSYYLEAPGFLGGDKKKALALAEEIGKINPSRGYLAQVTIAVKENGNDATIEQLYQKAVEADPRNYDALVSMTSYYLQPQRTNLSLAEKYANRALQVDPDRITAYCLLAQTFVKQNRGKEVPALLHKAEGAIPDNLAPYVCAGRAMLQQGTDLDTAEVYLQKYLTQPPEPGWPTHAGVHWSIGLVYEKRGEKAKARSEMEAALQLKPDFEPAKQALKRLK